MSPDAMESPGFVAIYRWIVADAHVDAFRQCWAEATENLKGFASHGSLLGKADDGSLIGIALWPDRATSDKAFAALAGSSEWPPSAQLEPIRVDVVDNRWVVSPFKTKT